MLCFKMKSVFVIRTSVQVSNCISEYRVVYDCRCFTFYARLFIRLTKRISLLTLSMTFLKISTRFSLYLCRLVLKPWWFKRVLLTVISHSFSFIIYPSLLRISFSFLPSFLPLNFFLHCLISFIHVPLFSSSSFTLPFSSFSCPFLFFSSFLLYFLYTLFWFLTVHQPVPGYLMQNVVVWQNISLICTR